MSFTSSDLLARIRLHIRKSTINIINNISRIIKDVSSLKTPNNTTDGMLKKAWVIEDGVRYLLKGGYKNETLQPFNEVLASEICSRLGFDHVEYNINIKILLDILIQELIDFVFYLIDRLKS